MTKGQATLAFLQACANEDGVALRAALEGGADPNATVSGDPPLTLVAMMGDEGLVDALLDAGARVDARTGSEGCTALYYLAANGRSEAHGRIMQRLIAAGADVDAQAPGLFGTVGSGPIQVAVQMKNPLAAEILIEHHARCTQALRSAARRLQTAPHPSRTR